uniref:ABC-type glutathione-S-conjugate transporter n=1 Tax=Tigriopus japonicus TaxID=158387 RepID=A0A0A7ARL9_TIGJA|nr:ATP-binding cassette transporter sub-family C member 1 isoform X7 [Tigriopus japonicus]
MNPRIIPGVNGSTDFYLTMDFCKDPFYNSSLTWNTTNPDITQCMQDTLLTGVPCLFFLLTEPLWIIYKIYYYSIQSFPISRDSRNTWGWKFLIKVTLNLVLITNLILQIWNQSHDEFYGSEVFRFMAMIGTIVLMLVAMGVEKWNRIHTSPPMFLFWGLLLLVKIPTVKDHVEHLTNDPSDVLYWILAFTYYPVFLLQIIFHCWADHSNMDASDKPPESVASFPATIFYTWIDPLIWAGLKAPLTLDQVPPQPQYVTVSFVIQDFLNQWSKKVSKIEKTFIKDRDPAGEKKVKILDVLFATYGKRFFLIFLLGTVNFTLIFVGPIMLKLLIQHVQSDEEAWKGFAYVILIFVNASLQSLLNHQFLQQTVISAQQIRASLSSMIYRKTLKLSNLARKKFTMGEITNFISTDIQTLGMTIPYMNNVWVAPMKIIIAMFFLYEELKSVAFIGVAIMAVLLPLNYWSSVIIKKMRKNQMEAKDGRIKLMNEVLKGMRVLKLYAWEIPFMSRINAIRLTEVKLMKSLAKVYAISNFTLNSGPTLITIACFGLYTVFQPGEILTADKIFVSIALFNIIRMSMVMLPWAIVALLKAFVSLKRIADFLNANELDPEAVGKETEHEENAIEITKGSFTWTEEEEQTTLKDINVQIRKGSLVAVVGVVGAGKSSLLSAILGEMEKTDGQINQSGTLAYVPQQAWIQNMTLKNNILFEKPFETGRYKRTLEACALKDDLDILISGDETEIGENGINLSGGQKQRVSVARAVYSDSDVYLLDDPLSAVDAHVGKHLFDKVFSSKSGILKDRTRVLVTHNVSFLDQMDLILVMRNGTIAERGSYSQLKESKGAFSEFLEQYANQATKEEVTEDHEKNKHLQAKPIKARQIPPRTRRMSQTLSCSPASPFIKYLSTSADAPLPDDILAEEEEAILEETIEESAVSSRRGSKVNDPLAGRLVDDEEAMIGKVNWKVYLSYMKDLGNIISVISFLLYMVGQGLESGSSYWLSFWADSNGADPATANDKTPFYLGVYSGIGALQIIIMIVREIVLFIACADASNLIHARLLSKVVSSPMSFFDTNPIGRIVNRFSADIGTVDDGIPFQISLLFECFTSIATVLALICYSLPIFMTVILPLAFMYYGIQRCYISTTRQLQRIESIVISPIFAHFGESLNGVQSIRAYKQEERFILESEKRVDKGVQLHYMCVMMNRWLGVRIEFLANLVVFFVALFAVLSRGTISPGLTGLAITFSLNVTGMLNWLIRAVCDMETDAVALERILEYSENPQEADWSLPEDDKFCDFPMEGQIEFSKYETRYREGLDLVLKDVSMRIQPKEKIGICGRTGAGKSSLTLALFRIIEPVSGKILVDGIDVNTLGLHKLRSGLTIIPQDPVLFTGNVRFNLDPTEENTDTQIWQALEHANLKAHISSLTNGLDHEVSEGGDNFSVGQRQLLCLARALLRKTKILILDEATAAVDLETDDLIQATIRKEFADCTVLTIAHRLNTILDSDRVAVFSEGKLVELDSPQSLMDKHDSVFRGLAKNAGLV